MSGSEKGVFWKSYLFESPFSRDSREEKIYIYVYIDSDSRDLREPRTVGTKGESDHFPEILDNFEILVERF